MRNRILKVLTIEPKGKKCTGSVIILHGAGEIYSFITLYFNIKILLVIMTSILGLSFVLINYCFSDCITIRKILANTIIVYQSALCRVCVKCKPLPRFPRINNNCCQLLIEIIAKYIITPK